MKGCRGGGLLFVCCYEGLPCEGGGYCLFVVMKGCSVRGGGLLFVCLLL